MKQRNILTISIIAFFLLISHRIFLVTIGSDTAVTRFNTQQRLQDGDRVAGFASLDAGFFLEGFNTRATFDSFFQVSGDINLNSGELVLNQDLILHNQMMINTLGDIVGQGHMLDLSCDTTMLPSVNADEAACLVFLVDQEITNQVRPILSLDWSVSDTFLAVGTSVTGGTTISVEIWQWNGLDTLTFKNGVLPNNKNVRTVRWHPTKNWLAVGTLNNSSGSEVFIYSVNWTTGALTLLDSQEVGGDARSIEWHPSGNYLAVGTSTNTQEVQLYEVNGSGIFGASVIVSSGNVDVAENDGLSWDITGNYLAVAFEQSVPNPELRIYEFGTAPLSLTQVAVIDKASSSRAVDWSPTYSYILAVGFEGNVSVTTEIYHFDATAGTVSLIAEIPNINKTTQTLDWDPTGSCIAIGTSAPNDDEFRVYSFDNDTHEVDFVTGFDYGSDQVDAVRWSHATRSLATGGNDTIIYIYKNAFTPGDSNDPNGPGALSRCFNWSNICVKLNNNLYLNDRCILFSGCSYIDGRGHCLTLGPGSRIFLDKNSTLLMGNITIKDVHDNIIGAFDDSSTFSLKNVEWILDGNYTFTKGFFDVVGDFDIVGDGYTFAYQSEAVSTIRDCGCMTLDSGTTFSYDPVTMNKNLFQLTASTSKLILHGATLHATQAGLQLTKGKLIAERKSFITSEATEESEAVSFGDGVNSSNNLQVEFPGLLEVVNGCVVYNDV